MPISAIAIAVVFIALAIAVFAIAAKWRAWRTAPPIDETSRHFGISGEYIDAGPYRMFHRVARAAQRANTRAPIVLVHGLVISSRYMEPLAHVLAREFDVYAPDLPGFGESRLARHRDVLTIAELADALHLWLRACRIERAMFIGNSFGCEVLADFASRYDEAVDRLVLQAPTSDPQARSLLQQIARDLRNGRRETVRSPAALARIDYAKAGLWRAVATARLVVRDRIETRLPRVLAPTLVVVGTRDPVVPLAWARDAAQRLPNGALMTIEGGTHTLNYVYPNAFAFAILPFLRGRCRRIR